MTVLYIINFIVLIITTVALILHFLVIKKQRELTDMNNIVLGMNSLFTRGKLICREPDCSTRGISVHTAISNNEPILVIDLFKDSKKDTKISELEDALYKKEIETTILSQEVDNLKNKINNEEQ